MKTKIGVIIFSLGLMMGDSENLVVPFVLIALGAWMMRKLVTR